MNEQSVDHKPHMNAGSSMTPRPTRSGWPRLGLTGPEELWWAQLLSGDSIARDGAAL